MLADGEPGQEELTGMASHHLPTFDLAIHKQGEGEGLVPISDADDPWVHKCFLRITPEDQDPRRVGSHLHEVAARKSMALAEGFIQGGEYPVGTVTAARMKQNAVVVPGRQIL
jgi:hypothetical protein